MKYGAGSMVVPSMQSQPDTIPVLLVCTLTSSMRFLSEVEKRGGEWRRGMICGGGGGSGSSRCSFRNLVLNTFSTQNKYSGLVQLKELTRFGITGEEERGGGKGGGEGWVITEEQLERRLTR
ncbi:hypothetical protein M0802_007236 [Mischocyttarus mexicanus]|nr:hypothetical protein M0802_007236 [Mischocyttarus mexicanus]